MVFAVVMCTPGLLAGSWGYRQVPFKGRVRTSVTRFVPKPPPQPKTLFLLKCKLSFLMCLLNSAAPAPPPLPPMASVGPILDFGVKLGLAGLWFGSSRFSWLAVSEGRLPQKCSQAWRSWSPVPSAMGQAVPCGRGCELREFVA